MSAVKRVQKAVRRFRIGLDGLGHLGAVSSAAALALAAILGFAAIVAGFAAALTLAVILAFTGVLCRLVLIDVLQAGLGGLDGSLGRVGRGGMCNRGSTNQTGESSRQQHCIQLVLHER